MGTFKLTLWVKELSGWLMSLRLDLGLGWTTSWKGHLICFNQVGNLLNSRTALTVSFPVGADGPTSNAVWVWQLARRRGWRSGAGCYSVRSTKTVFAMGPRVSPGLPLGSVMRWPGPCALEGYISVVVFRFFLLSLCFLFFVFCLCFWFW